MRAAGAQPIPLTRRQMTERIPFLRPPWESGLWDGLAGSLRIRRALSALARQVTVRQATVRAVEDGDVHLDGAETLAADVVLVCAGLATGRLAAALDVDMRAFHHVRLTYRGSAPGACLIAPEGYGVPLGGTGRWALGLHEEAPPPLASESPDAAAAATRRRHAEWVPRTFPGLDPEPVDEIRCVSLEAPWLDAGDGFVIRRAARVVALAGGNLMKFGPVLGERLARAALT
jgi:sarcosine oxidase